MACTEGRSEGDLSEPESLPARRTRLHLGMWISNLDPTVRVSDTGFQILSRQMSFLF